MRHPLSLLLTLLLPLAAVGQSVGSNSAQAEYLLMQPSARVAASGPVAAVPLWLGGDGHLLTLKVGRSSGADALYSNAPLTFGVVGTGNVVTTGLQFGIAPNLNAHAELSEHSWVNQPWRVLGSEVGATYVDGRYSIDLSVGGNRTPNSQAVLPRVLLGASPGVDGLSGFDSSTQFNARGRLAIGSRSGIDLGASVGHIYLLPGNLLGVSMLDQKALSLGVDHGPLRGTLIGRTMQPQVGIPGSFNADRRWNSIDLGVTWRLPWQGELSIGAQNLWSSGNPSNTPVGPEPDQSRTPYVQYHQDL
ncbi:MAG: hypothetical protein KGJ97_01755 [Xanthomonadaceae bacterium]|nr:hypothetical protein [Xanthomonadaceae bacterium]MDE3072107.1 hypothetical protein [Pseudomonadota bacterium]